MKKEFLEAGKIINTHGVRGDIKIDSWCDSPEVLADIKELYLSESAEDKLEIERTSVFKHFVLAHPKGFSNFEDAIKLKNKIVYVRREDIAKDEDAVFIVDLIGLPVINAESGKVYGRVASVSNNNASDVYEIETDNGVAYMPAVPEFISEIDLEKGVFVTPIEGIFDEI